MRFLFGLKSWTNYALQFHRLDRELDPHSDTFLVLFSKSFCRVIAMLSTSYECRGCPGVVVDCKTLLIFLLTWGKQTIICRFLKKCKRYSPIHSHIELNPGHSAFLVVVFFPPDVHVHFILCAFFIVSHDGEAKWPKSLGEGSPAQLREFKPPFILCHFELSFELLFILFYFFFPLLYLSSPLFKTTTCQNWICCHSCSGEGLYVADLICSHPLLSSLFVLL